MSFLSTARTTVTHLRQTVHTRYGGGVRGYANFFYFSLLRTNTFIIFVHDCADDSAGLLPADDLVFVRNDFERLEKFRRSRDLPREFYCDQTHGARDFILGIWQGNVAYIHWIFYEGDKTRFLSLGNGCAETAYYLTLPEFRGNRICSYALAHTAQTLSGEGVQRLFGVIHDDNIASIKAVKRVGFREFARTRAIGLFNTRRDVTA